MVEFRQEILMAVCGKKAVGKSFTTIKYIRDYVNRSPRRKALIFDVNNEYADKKKYPDIITIALKDIPAYSLQRYPQIRRVGPFFDDGKPMSLDDMSVTLQWLVRNYKNGLLLAEDINKYVTDNMPGDLVGALCTNRHIGLDIILHYQSIGRLTTKVWQNISVLRMHRNTDSVDRHKLKFEDKYEYLKIAEIVVAKQYKDGNTRYYLFVDFDKEKVHTGLSKEKIMEAINDYISDNYAQIVGRYLNRRDDKGSQIFKSENAFVAAKQEIYDLYFDGAS